MKKETLERVELPPCDVLREIIETEQVVLPNGERKKAVGGIGSLHARALYDVVLYRKPDLVVEVGMAQGVSTLSILCALKQTGGRLISIDPYINWPSGRKAALHAVARAGYAEHHTHMEDVSYRALPELLLRGTQVDLAYIDGSHLFEHVFLDFFYLDQMLRAGGVMAFDDAGWRSVFKVIRYLQKNRVYNELDVGLRRNYAARNLFFRLLRRLLRMPRQDRYFEKQEVRSL